MFDCGAVDGIVIGAGFSGATVARELARGGKSVLVLERRDHVGGNAYDRRDDSGILIQLYGPHIFHTNDEGVFAFLSTYTEWHAYHHEVVGAVDGKALPIPFNLNSLRVAFGEARGAQLAQKLIDAYGMEHTVGIRAMMAHEDADIREIAEYAYRNVFYTYTRKQWGHDPDELDPAVLDRVPVKVTYRNGYFDDAHQGLPKQGFTKLFEAMLAHPAIDVRLSCEPELPFGVVDGALCIAGQPIPQHVPVVYTGALDELFGYAHGRLSYRAMAFDFETHPVEFYQSHGTVNYTVSEPYTRITEFKRLTGQVAPVTTIAKEYSLAYEGSPEQTPSYPVFTEANRAQYGRYVELAKAHPNLHLAGRLAEYTYYNMDAAVRRALNLAAELLNT